MREFLFWALVLTALPGCQALFGLDDIHPPDATTPDNGFNLIRGSLPRNGVVFCDIVQARRCATALDKLNGIRLTDAAVALNEGRSSDIGLDYSPEALAECNGEPVALQFHGKFPEGLPVCLNCDEVLGSGKANPDAAAVCQAQCYDLVLGPPNSEGASLPVKPPTEETIAFCTTAARVSTNGFLDACFADACEDTGALKPFYVDPRRTPEPVVWTDPIGVAASGAEGNDLSRSVDPTGSYDAGAVSTSTQWIKAGDAWVEFSVDQTAAALVAGFAEIPGDCAEPCPDNDATLGSIAFGLNFGSDGRLYILEDMVDVPGPDINGSFGLYAAGERFRLRVSDKGDGTATLRYTRLVGSCIAGSICNEQEIHVSSQTAHYPLRVDTSLRLKGVTLTDVRLVRIH